MIDAIVTVPPLAPFIREIAAHPIVSGIRLNTVMPLKGTIEDTLNRLRDEAGKPVWIDLKARQLRVEGYWVPPFTEVVLSHPFSVDCPTTAYFSDGEETATVVGADGNRLLLQEGLGRVIGPGESVNIPHRSLRIEGYLTDTDNRYIEAATKTNMHDYMLSFVESTADLHALRTLDPQASIIAKIESREGLRYIHTSYDRSARLMAARGDLYVEVRKPHHIIEAVEDIAHADRTAVVASRLFPSLQRSYTPSCQDISDVAYLLKTGYRTFMLGDDICMRKESALSALNILQEMTGRYT
jgi:hypothetical protein